MKYYTDLDINNLDKKAKHIVKIIIFIIAVALLSCLMFVLCGSYENYKLHLLMSILLSTISGWICISIYFTRYLPLIKRIAFIKQINSQRGTKIITECVFCDTVTLYNGQHIRELKSVDSGAVFYWETTLGDIPFSEREKVSLYIVDGFIVGYEDDCYE